MNAPNDSAPVPATAPGGAWFPATVGLEGIGDFPAQITLARWNGYAIPRFEREVMETIVRVQHELHRDYAAHGEAYMFLDLAWDADTVVIYDHAASQTDPGAACGVRVLGPDEDGFYRYGGGFLWWETVSDRWANRPHTLLSLAASGQAERLYLARRAIADGASEAARAADEALYRTVMAFGIPLTSADEAIDFLARALEDRARYQARTPETEARR